MKVTKQTVSQVEWLASTRLQSFTEPATSDMTSGEVYKKNGTAVGVVLNDVKATPDDPAPVAVMVEGWVRPDRLPEELSDADKTALKAAGIKFREPLEADPETPTTPSTPAE